MVLVEFSHSDKERLLDVMDKAGYDNPFNLREDFVFVKRQTWREKTFLVSIYVAPKLLFLCVNSPVSSDVKV